MILSSYGILSSSRPDPDAQAFITAVGLTDPTQIYGIEYLTWGLKNFGLWDKTDAAYPVIGSTSSTQKWNLKNPVDSDAGFRLVFNGGWAHSSSGASPNGTNAYADTFLTPSTTLTLNDTHMSYYSRTNDWGGTKFWVDMGANTTSDQRVALLIKYANNAFIGDMYGATNGRVTTSMNLVASTGLFVLSRTSSTSLKAYRNGSQIGTTNTASNPDQLPDRKVLLAALQQDDGTPFFFAGRQCAFASVGAGLTDAEVSNLNLVVQNYQTILSRKV